jgi:hypothetical protein
MPEPYREAWSDLEVLLLGSTSDDERWETCVSLTAYGELKYGVTAMFVEKHFTEDNKKEVLFEKL